MNFFFGQLHTHSTDELSKNLQNWLAKTIFSEIEDGVSMHCEEGFSLTLINDPKRICRHQSNTIHIDDEYICASDCILYNKAALARELEITPNATNEQFIISSFKKWGRLFPDKFDGKFSFVLWDRHHKKLTGGRDALGYGNFCYSQNKDRLFFSSDLATLLDQPQVDKSINTKRFYQCFRYTNNPPEQTYFKYCFYCPPSHIFEYSDHSTTSDYWQLDQNEFDKNRNNELSNCKQYISLVEQAIANETHENPSTGLMLSGGLDSSLLAAVLSKKDNWKQLLTCYSYIFKKHKTCDESERITDTVGKLRLDSVPIHADQHHVFADLQTRGIIKDMINLDGYAALPELIFKRANQDQKQLVILGHYGDDLFGGNQYKFADLIVAGNFKSILKMIFNARQKSSAFKEFIHFGIRPLLPKSIKRYFRQLVKPKHSANYFGIKSHQVNNIDEKLKFSNTRLFHQQNLLKLIYYSNTSEGIYYYRKHLYLGHKLKYVMPFYSKKMVEFFWNLPVDQLNKPGESRWLQRQSLRLMKLNKVADTIKKTEFTELFSTGINCERSQIIQFIENLRHNRTIKLPDKLVEKLKKGEKIENSEAGNINAYLLAALWWQSIKNTDESFNQINKIELEANKFACRNSKLWSAKS